MSFLLHRTLIRLPWLASLVSFGGRQSTFPSDAFPLPLPDPEKHYFFKGATVGKGPCCNWSCKQKIQILLATASSSDVILRISSSRAFLLEDLRGQVQVGQVKPALLKIC